MHHVHVLISTTEVFEPVKHAYQHAHVVLLPQNLALLPVTKEFASEIAQHDPSARKLAFDQFEALTRAVAALAQNLSRTTPVVYAETDHFGGTGAQAAIVWENKEVAIGPLVTKNFPEGLQGILITSVSEGAINQALRSISVVCNEHIDEFDAIELGRYRSDDDWIKISSLRPGGE